MLFILQNNWLEKNNTSDRINYRKLRENDKHTKL
jgi:hypothetical protein